MFDMRSWLPSILFLCAAVVASAQTTVLTHATLIDGSGQAPVSDAAIIIEGGTIRDAGPSSRVKAPEGATVVDLKGKTVIPGIINLHGHVGIGRALARRQQGERRRHEKNGAHCDSPVADG